MQHIFESTKRLVSICLVTLLLVTSTLLSFPTPAKADGDVVFVKCEPGSDCGNIGAFTAGVAAGSAVTLMATGNTAILAAAGTTITGAVAGVVSAAAPLAAVATPGAAVAAAPVVVPAVAVGAVGYGAYRMWEGRKNSQTQSSK